MCNGIVEIFIFSNKSAARFYIGNVTISEARDGVENCRGCTEFYSHTLRPFKIWIVHEKTCLFRFDKLRDVFACRYRVKFYLTNKTTAQCPATVCDKTHAKSR